MPSERGTVIPAPEEKPLRSREEIVDAVDILLKAVKGSTEAKMPIPAGMAMALAWALNWEPTGGEFQKMLDTCRAMDRDRKAKP